MSITIKFNAGPSINTWNNQIQEPVNPSTIISDCIDINNIATGVQLLNIGTWTNNISDAPVADGVYHTWEEDVWDDYWYSAIANNGDFLRLTGLTPNAEYTIKIAAARGVAGRDTTFDATDSDGSKLYVSAAGLSPNIQVSLTGTVPLTGIVDISITGSSSYLYFNGFEIEYTLAGTEETHTVEFNQDIEFTDQTGISFVNTTTGETASLVVADTSTPAGFINYTVTWATPPVIGDVIEWRYDGLGNYTDTGLTPLEAQTLQLTNCLD